MEKNNGLRLGELVSELSKHDPNLSVEFDFGAAIPTYEASFRGYYEDLAIGYDGSRSASRKTVADMVKMLGDAIGSTYHGWKGGAFTMCRDTYVWVAVEGNSSNTYISEVYSDGYSVILRTGNTNFDSE